MPTPQKITPFLWFNTNAEEAAAFYTSIFKNSRIGAVSRYSDNMPLPKGTAMTVSFELEGQQFIAMNGGPGHPFTDAISLSVSCDTQAEIDDLWARLTANGGTPIQCGWLKDRFGLCWQIVPAIIPALIENPATSPRVMQAVMQMVKLDIAKLKAAAAGT